MIEMIGNAPSGAFIVDGFSQLNSGGKIDIDATQFFDKAPEVAWKFYIGGYQPAQKWLKDRKGRTLTLDDVKHYQKILKILAETDRVMGKIAI